MKTKFKKRFNNDIVIKIDQKNIYKFEKNKSIFYFSVKGNKELDKIVYIETEHDDKKIENIEIKIIDNKLEENEKTLLNKSAELYEIVLEKFDNEALFNRILIPITYVYKEHVIGSVDKYSNNKQNIILSIEYDKLDKKLACKVITNYKVVTVDEDFDFIQNRLLNKFGNIASEYFKSYGIFASILDIGKIFFGKKK